MTAKYSQSNLLVFGKLAKDRFNMLESDLYCPILNNNQN